MQQEVVDRLGEKAFQLGTKFDLVSEGNKHKVIVNIPEKVVKEQAGFGVSCLLTLTLSDNRIAIDKTLGGSMFARSAANIAMSAMQGTVKDTLEPHIKHILASALREEEHMPAQESVKLDTVPREDAQLGVEGLHMDDWQMPQLIEIRA